MRKISMSILQMTLWVICCFIANPASAQTVIKLDKEGSQYTTHCEVNGLKLKLEIATGAFEVGISPVEAAFMIKNGYIKKSDILDGKYYESADGEVRGGAEIILRKIDISGYVLKDVKAIVIGSQNMPLLIGQNALSRIGKITMDYNNSTLTIADGPKNDQSADPNNPHNIDNDKIELVHVNGGKFPMGSNDGKEEEAPVHLVTIKSFSIGKYEVTVGQFREFIEATGYRTTAESEGNAIYLGEGKRTVMKGANWNYNTSGFRHKASEDYEPVLFTSWYDAQRFCEWTSTKTGKHYRLPTEAEWEYAAKGGDSARNFKYSGSNDIDEVGWFKGNAGWQIRIAGLKKPNQLGIYDMTGNVLEYCSDWFDNHYYKYSPAENPKGPEEGKEKVVRGGAVTNDAVDCRNTDRHWDEPTSRCNYNGFRVAVDD